VREFTNVFSYTCEALVDIVACITQQTQRERKKGKNKRRKNSWDSNNTQIFCAFFSFFYVPS
jgi:hypothetical protein